MRRLRRICERLNFLTTIGSFLAQRKLFVIIAEAAVSTSVGAWLLAPERRARVLTGAVTAALLVTVPTVAFARSAAPARPYPIFGAKAEARRGIGEATVLVGAKQVRTTRQATSGDPLLQRNGVVLHKSTAYVIFWQPPSFSVDSKYQATIQQFFKDLAADSGRTTNAYSVATQYWDTSGAAAYQTRFGGSYVDSDAFPTIGGCKNSPASVCLSDSNISREVKTVIAREKWPTDSMANGDIYFLFLPKDVDMCSPGEGKGTCAKSIWESCSDLSGCASSPKSLGCTEGYHSSYASGSSRVLYAPIVYENSSKFSCYAPNNTRPNGTDADYDIDTASHELIEAVTDPLGNNWGTQGGLEIGDPCEDGPLTVQNIGGHQYDLQGEVNDLASGGTCSPTYVPSRSLSLSTNSGPPGTPISVSGRGLDPQEPLVMLFDGKKIADESSAASDGTVATLNWNFPSSATVGNHSLTLRGKYTAAGATAALSITSVPLSYYSGHIVQWDGDKKSQKTAWYVSSDLKRHWIYDASTYNCLRSQRAPAPDVLSSTVLNQLPDVTGSWATCGGVAFEGSIVRQAGGTNWVILNQQRHLEPDAATDLCARYVDGRKVSFTNVDSASIASIPLGSPYKCSIDDVILTAQDQNPKPSYAITGGKRHGIPDTWTYHYLQEKAGFNKVININTNAEILTLPSGGDETPTLNPDDIPTTSIVRRSDGVSWVVGGSKIRHHIPFAQDDVCWRDLKGYTVTATGLTATEANEVGPEKDAWPCIIGNRVVQSDDGSSWFVDTTNTRHKIPDTDTYYWYAHRYPVTPNQWPHADVNQIPRGSDEPHQIDPTLTVNKNGGGGGTVTGGGINCGGTCSVTFYNTTTTVTLNQSAAGDSGFWQWSGACSGTGGCTVTMNQNQTVTATFVPTYTIKSKANGLYVSAELGYTGGDYGLLRARNSSVGVWEKFVINGDCSSRCAFQSLGNHDYVSAEFGYGGNSYGELRVRNTSWGGWETFHLVGNCNSSCAIRSNPTGNYVSAEIKDGGAYYARLRARSGTWGGWESYIIQRG